MKFECSIEKLKKAISNGERVTGKNLTLPVLSSILFVVAGKSVKLRATNLSLGIELEVPAKVEQEGVCAVSGTLLLSLFSTMYDEGVINVELKNGNLEMITKKNSFILKGQPAEDFPTLPTVEGESIIIPLKKLIEGFKAVYYSASLSEIKPEISSVYMYSDQGSLVFVSTDSFRLAEKKIKTKEKYEFSPIIIPYKNILEIVRVCQDIDTDAHMVIGKNQIVFETQGLYLTSRVIDGVFPDYKQIIPKAHTTEATILKQDAMNALKVSNIFSDKFNQITLSINPKEKKIKLYAKNNDVGENTTSVDGALSGEQVDLNVNYKYVFDCFQSIHQDSVVFRSNGSNKPLVIQGSGDTSFTYLVMPMNR